MTLVEVIETRRLGVAGLTGDCSAFVTMRPVRLDELPEFRRYVLEVLRQLLEENIL
jgi:hypothetical protein